MVAALAVPVQTRIGARLGAHLTFKYRIKVTMCSPIFSVIGIFLEDNTDQRT